MRQKGLGNALSEIYAVQLTAVATLVLAVLALATAVLAFLAWRKQSREVRDQAEMLQLQAREFRQLSADREHEALERRRAQAVLVYMWEEVNTFSSQVYLRNTSQQPLYWLRFGWRQNAQFTGLVNSSHPLMPGETIDTTLQPPVRTAEGIPGAVAIFRDRAGIWWCTWPDGRLEEMPQVPIGPDPDEDYDPSAPEWETVPELEE